MPDPLIIRVISVCFALLFLIAAVHKLAGAARFRAVLADYQLLPDALVPPMTRVVAVIELLLGLGWLIAYRTPVIAVISTMLLAVYAAAIGINLVRGRVHIGCGCGFGGTADEDQQLSWGLVLRNGALIVAAAVAALPPAQRQLGVVDYVSLIAAVLASVLLYAAANQLLSNRAAINSWRNAKRARHE